MYFNLHATKYKGHMFWGDPSIRIVTEDPKLAKEFGFVKHPRCKNLYTKQLDESEVDEIYYVTRKGTYHGYSILVVEYSCKANDYRIYSSEMNLIEELGFTWYDRNICYKDVPIDEVLDVVDEYDLQFKNGE